MTTAAFLTSATLDDSTKRPTLPSQAQATLHRRAAALWQRDMDYIPNPSFALAGLATSQLPIDTAFPTPRGEALPMGLPPHLSRLCQTDLLSREDESELFRQMNYRKFLAAEFRQQLDPVSPQLFTLDLIDGLLQQAQDIRDYLIQANLRLVMSIVKKFVTPCQSFDELLSEGTVTLIQAVEKFDFDRGFRFSTYAYRSISRTAFRFVSAAREEEARLTRDADEWAFGQTDEQASSTMTDQLWNGLREFTRGMLQRLDRRERLIIRSRFALGSHRRVRSFQDLANRLGVSKERVRQIEARAIGKLQAMAQEFMPHEFDPQELRMDEVHVTISRSRF